MNTNLKLSFRMRGLATFLLGLVLIAVSGPVIAQYQGAETCSSSSCHRTQYRQWLTSGHHFILMEEEPAESRGVLTPPGTIWDDFSYMIGGHKTKALFLDRDGYIYTPSSGDNQYNLLTGEFSDYHAGETDKVYDCGSCHTTGYEAGGNPDGFPGISGTFALPGVECEHCHGPGLSMEEGDPAICKDCHNHGPETAVKASGGFIVSEGQHNEFMAGPHAALSNGCVSCHNPHEPAATGIKTQCESCHSAQATAYENELMHKVGVECKDCHMAPATLSAQALGPHEGDMRTHIFYINTDPGANMFTQDGNNVALTGGKGAVTLDFACQRCHQGASLQELARFAKDFHNPDKTLDDFGLDGGLTGTWWNAARAGEGFVLQFGYVPTTTTLTLFASFYTYDNMGNQVWLVALPTAGSVPDSGADVDVTVYRVTGPMWGDDFDPADRNTVEWGTGTFSFPTCTSGNVSLTPGTEAQGQGFTDLTYALTREDFLGTATACPSFANNTQ